MPFNARRHKVGVAKMLFNAKCYKVEADEIPLHIMLYAIRAVRMPLNARRHKVEDSTIYLPKCSLSLRVGPRFRDIVALSRGEPPH